MTVTVFLLSFEFQRAHGRAFQRLNTSYNSAQYKLQ